MAYVSTLAAVVKILDAGIAAIPSTGAGISGGNSILKYVSSHAAEDITTAGFFQGIGAQPYSSSGPPPYDSIGRSTNNVGARPGDILFNVESSDGATPGRASLHAITGSTLGASGHDCTVGAHAST